MQSKICLAYWIHIPLKSNLWRSSTLVADTPISGDRSSALIFCQVQDWTLSLLRVSATAWRILDSILQKSNIRSRRSAWLIWKHICEEERAGKLVQISSSTLITSASFNAKSRLSVETISKSTSPNVCGWPPDCLSRKTGPKANERWT